MPSREDVIALIKRKCREKGITPKGLSLACGVSHSYFSEFFKGKRAKIAENVRAKAAGILDEDEALLRIDDYSPKLREIPEPPNARIGGIVSLDLKIPAFGQAEGGKHGEFPLNGNWVRDVPAPPSLRGVKDAFAVQVAGTSMEPRYMAGELVYVHPRKALTKGCFVVAEIAAKVEGDPPLAYVKRFISRDDKRLRLEQLNPPKMLEFPSDKVVRIHRIIMGGEE